MTAPSGVLVVNKPSGPTSHDIVAQARRLLHTRAVGHAGTLDPMASGVLLLLIEEATKLSSALVLDKKSYRATIRFGCTTDSDDALGVPIRFAEVSPGWLDPNRLEAALLRERQRSLQQPPQVSAIKLNGVAAHRLHRRGELVQPSSRQVRVHELSVIRASDEELELALTVSKGYYVRALARDLGLELSMPAHLSALCRTSSGCFDLQESVAWPCSGTPKLLSLAEVARRSLPTRTITAEGTRRARMGQRLLPEHFHVELEVAPRVQPAHVVAWLDAQGTLVALGQQEPDGSARVVRGFRDAE